MTTAEIKQLLPSLANGQCSQTDVDNFDNWLKTASFEDASEVMDLYYPLIKNATIDEATAQSLYQQIENSLNLADGQHLKPVLRFKVFQWKMIAAAAILIAGISFFLLFKTSTSANNIASIEKRFQNDVPAGGNKAKLILEDGSELILDNGANQPQPANTAGININYQQGSVTYQSVANTKAIEYNTISIPRGGQYQLTMSDGTKVWLNAATTLKFPRAFAGNQRTVELSGEAYFEVAKNQNAPFVVKVNNMEVQVLGTHFNVKAYPDESCTKTTLLEGSVQLQAGNHRTLLQPGKQGVFDGGNILVNDVNTAEAVAWKDGHFLFDKSDVETIMQQFERWYDINVQYEAGVPKNRFVGEFSRDLSLAASLKILELSGIHFTISGNNITVLNR
jgi:transmembrane sensor